MLRCIASERSCSYAVQVSVWEATGKDCALQKASLSLDRLVALDLQHDSVNSAAAPILFGILSFSTI